MKLYKKCGLAIAIVFSATNVVCAQQLVLTDPEIAHVAVTANQIDIGYAGIASKKSQDPAVQKFAETMARDHNAVIDQAVALVKKLGVTPRNNDFSKKLLAGASDTKKNLQAKSGKAFDNAYINNEVAYHKSVIAAIEQTLIPQSKNPELKKLLQDVLPAFKAHLEHAEMIQQKIKK